MATRKVTIAVDKNFFDNVFERQRKKLQKQLGLGNLSQANFTKMIEIKIKPPKVSNTEFKIKKRGRKRDDFFKI